MAGLTVTDTNVESEGRFSILALDGGAIRGIYAAHLLARLEDVIGSPLRECFSPIAGTSTGSIIEGAASMQIPMESLVDLFETRAEGMFGKRSFSFIPFIRSRYSTGVATQRQPELAHDNRTGCRRAEPRTQGARNDGAEVTGAPGTGSGRKPTG